MWRLRHGDQAMAPQPCRHHSHAKVLPSSADCLHMLASLQPMCMAHDGWQQLLLAVQRVGAGSRSMVCTAAAHAGRIGIQHAMEHCAHKDAETMLQQRF